MKDSFRRFTSLTKRTNLSTIFAGTTTSYLSPSRSASSSQWLTLNKAGSVPFHAWIILPFVFLKKLQASRHINIFDVAGKWQHRQDDAAERERTLLPT